LYSHR